MDEVIVAEKTYISSKRAAQSCGYAQDYIGQLARKGLIDAQRIGGLWYVLLESVEAYKKQAESYKPEPQKYAPQSKAESEINLHGKDYLSAAPTTELTGYNADYIGQLARGGKIPSHQIGNRWYIDKEALIHHKDEKDGLLAAFQAESVGLKQTPDAITQTADSEAVIEPLLSYSADEKDLMPVIKSDSTPVTTSSSIFEEDATSADEPVSTSYSQPIPIRIVDHKKSYAQASSYSYEKKMKKAVRIPRKTMFLSTLGGSALLIVVVLITSISLAKNSPIFTSAVSNISRGNFSASASSAIDSAVKALEPILTKEIVYIRK